MTAEQKLIKSMDGYRTPKTFKTVPENLDSSLEERILFQAVLRMGQDEALSDMIFKKIWANYDDSFLWEDLIKYLGLLTFNLNIIRDNVVKKPALWKILSPLLAEKPSILIAQLSSDIMQIPHMVKVSNKLKNYRTEVIKLLDGLNSILKEMQKLDS